MGTKKLNYNLGTQFTGEGNVVAPFTEIQNRAKIDTNCMVVGSTERVHFNNFKLVPKEEGPNGQRVYSLDTEDSRIRFVGEWQMAFESSGHLATLLDPQESPFVEVTFYGTGLNIMYQNEGTVDRNPDVTVDGVSQGILNIIDKTLSGILTGRNYAPRRVVNVVYGLDKGWHTVKLRNRNLNTPYWQGLEILNETQNELTVLPGKVYKNGYEFNLDQEILFETRPSSLSAPNGARGLIYFDPIDGEVKQAFRSVPIVPPVSPVELITNGTFDTDLSNWTNITRASWDPSGRVLIDATSGSGGRQLEQELTVVDGQRYAFSVDFEGVVGVNGNIYVGIFSGPDATGILLSNYTTTAGAGVTGTATGVFVAQGTTAYIYLTLQNNGQAAYYDNVSVFEATAQGKFLTDTDHSEEAIAYEVESRDFGRDRGDDFRTLGGSGSTRSFTMEPNDFGLSCSNCIHGGPGGRVLFPNTTGSYYVIHFFGTGLDLIRKDNNDITSSQLNSVDVDGVNVGALSSNGSTHARVEKICSGLPLGSHSVRITLTNTANYSPGAQRFRVYQPKKPTISKQAVELAEYCLLADFQEPEFVGDPGGEQISSKGIVLKGPTREFAYIGSWTNDSISPGEMKTGIEMTGQPINAGFRYSFVGDKFIHFFTGETNNSSQIFIKLNGQLLTSANFPDATFNYVTPGGGAFFPLEGRINQGTSFGNDKGCHFTVTGLPYGHYTVEFEKTEATTFIRNSGIGITPESYAINFTTGSKAVNDIRNQVPVETEAVIDDLKQAVFNTKNINQILEVGTGAYIVWFDSPFFDDDKTVLTATQTGDKICSALGTSNYLSNVILQTTSSNGAQETGIQSSLKITNKTQSEIFKD